MKKTSKALLRALLLLWIALYVVLAPLVLLTCWIVSFFDKKASIWIVSRLAQCIWSVFGRIFRLTTNMTYPKKLSPRENYLVIANHIGSIDFMIINELAIPQKMLGNLKYLIKDAAMYIPVFGIGMKMAGFLYLKRNIAEDRRRIVEYCSFIKKVKIPLWLIVYPESSRFSEEKKVKSQEFCKKKGLPILNHVLFPRTGGFKIIADNLKGSHVKNVVDLTVFFETPTGKIPSLFDLLLGNASGSFKTDIQVFPLKEIENFDDFLINSFIRKDKLIDDWKNECKNRKIS